MFFTTLLLAQTLFVKTPDGNVYKAVNDVPVGQCILTGEEELVFEASNFNTCNEIVLQPGCYRAEMRGGIGTANENCLDHIAFDENTTMSAVFSISQPTTVYALRGGDGNPGEAIISGSYISSFGGGASGVDSILVIGDRVWRANGGAGKTCITGEDFTSTNTADSATTIAVGNGFGGGTNLPDDTNGARAFYNVLNKVMYSIGGGGGGAPNGVGGANWQYKSTFPADDIIINPGENGTSLSGGDGGSVTSCIDLDCTEMRTINGGKGGTTMSYICGGQYAYSYGGGGGGAAIRAYSTYFLTRVGGDGGSGSTGTSNVSFVRIYKM